MNPAGTLVRAAAAGQVILAGNDLETVYGAKPNFYGNLVIQELDHKFQGQPVYLLYGHLTQAIATAGQRLEPGEPVGLVGMTGAAVGNHLHLEVRLGGLGYENTRNPLLWLRPEPGQGVIAGLFVDAQGRPIPETPITFFRAAEPGKWWRQVQTYADPRTAPTPALGGAVGVFALPSDDQLGENFALGYVPAGDYLVKGTLGTKSYVEPVTVQPGEIAFVRIVAAE
jgi:murein DD-endopeptidase MepM/ murein hydrolase activator NlpD